MGNLIYWSFYVKLSVREVSVPWNRLYLLHGGSRSIKQCILPHHICTVLSGWKLKGRGAFFITSLRTKHSALQILRDEDGGKKLKCLLQEMKPDHNYLAVGKYWIPFLWASDTAIPIREKEEKYPFLRNNGKSSHF